MNAWVDVAVLTGTKTLDGRLVVRSAPGLPFLLSEGSEVFFVPPVNDVPRQAIVEEVSEGAGGDYILRFSAVSDKTTAGKLLGCHVLLRKDDLDSLSSALADSSLDGYVVVDVEMGYLGRVTGLRQMPAQHLLEVCGEDGEPFSIPFVDEFILEIDAEQKLVTVDVPSGLLSL